MINLTLFATVVFTGVGTIFAFAIFMVIEAKRNERLGALGEPINPNLKPFPRKGDLS